MQVDTHISLLCYSVKSLVNTWSFITDCICDAGFAGSDPTKCALCPSGYRCPGGGQVEKCPEDSYSGVGSTGCTCNLGYELTADNTCFRCPAGSYCPRQEGGVDMTPIACPMNANSPEGSFEASDCQCLEGYQNVAYDLPGNFFAVGPGPYDEVKQACAAGGGQLASINSRREAQAAGLVCLAGQPGNCYRGWAFLARRG